MPIIALNYQEHAALRVRSPATSPYLATSHMLPVVVHECAHAGTDSPVVFVKNAETGQFQLVALYGLSPDENLFVSDGDWRALYLPAVIRNNPFKLIADSEDPQRMLIGLDTDSELVQETEGEALFDEDGNETDFLVARKNALRDYYEHDRITRSFIALLSEFELLAARELKVNVDGQRIAIDGLYMVDEAKLDGLAEEKFGELRKRGFLAVIYAHLASLNQVRRLASLRAGN